jgi:hypothetical protein
MPFPKGSHAVPVATEPTLRCGKGLTGPFRCRPDNDARSSSARHAQTPEVVWGQGVKIRYRGHDLPSRGPGYRDCMQSQAAEPMRGMSFVLALLVVVGVTPGVAVAQVAHFVRGPNVNLITSAPISASLA